MTGLVPLDVKGARLVLPFDLIEVEEFTELSFRVVCEVGRIAGKMAFENFVALARNDLLLPLCLSQLIYRNIGGWVRTLLAACQLRHGSFELFHDRIDCDRKDTLPLP